MKSVGGPHAARGARGLDSTALAALAKSTEGKLSSLNGGQHATEERLKDLNLGQQDLMKAQSELAYTQIGQVARLADLAGRITSIESSIHGSRNPSPCPDYRVSSPMVGTQHVSAPSTSSALVETSQPQLRRSLRLQSEFRPDYCRFPSKTTLWQDRSIQEVDEDEERRNYVPFIQETAPKTIARETTVGRALGVIEASNVIARV